MINLDTVNLIDYLGKSKEDHGVFEFFQDSLLNKYNPDINGYTLLFMVPPELSGLKGKHGLADSLKQNAKLVTFASVDYSPPQEQMNTEKISGRTGGIPYATEFNISDQFSVTYIDNQDLNMYQFHQTWLYYIWDIVEGKIAPDPKYYDPANMDTNLYGAIDYMASFYIVKYRPDLKTISYIGKCIGVFPQSLPSKELIGQRTANELTTLPFQYYVSSYRSQVINSKYQEGWLYNELIERALSNFDISK